MKNIFEDETLPSAGGKPPIIRNDSKANMPSRPKREVTPPPMKQVQPQPVYAPLQQVPVQEPQQPQPPAQNAYQYIPVNPQYPNQLYPQQGVAYYPVYGAPQQGVYPQGVPYMPYPQYPAAAAPEQETAKEEHDPGTRVLYQSPDFENKDKTASG